jgi:hypothetical protein
LNKNLEDEMKRSWEHIKGNDIPLPGEDELMKNRLMTRILKFGISSALIVSSGILIFFFGSHFTPVVSLIGGSIMVFGIIIFLFIIIYQTISMLKLGEGESPWMTYYVSYTDDAIFFCSKTENIRNWYICPWDGIEYVRYSGFLNSFALKPYFHYRQVDKKPIPFPVRSYMFSIRDEERKRLLLFLKKKSIKVLKGKRDIVLDN